MFYLSKLVQIELELIIYVLSQPLAVYNPIENRTIT